MKYIYLIFCIFLLSGCSSYYEDREDYNYLPDNTIRFIKDEDSTSFLINEDDVYYLLLLDSNLDINSDYVIKLKDIYDEVVINDIMIKKNDKIEIYLDNYNFCIYMEKLDRDNYGSCDFIYLYNINEDFYITLDSNLLILFYDAYTKFNYNFMMHLSEVWIDSYTVDKSSYLDLTLYKDNFRVVSYKIRGKTIHKKINS